MPELPSLLRQRLQAAQNARLQHPDADTLTAYVEQLLPASERELVLKHIAVCGDCREIVFLAIPENAAVAAPESLVPEPMVPRAAASTVPARRRWFLNPGFGLAASVAAMALAIALVIEIPHRNQPLTPTSTPVRVEDKISKVQTPQVPDASPATPAGTGNTSVGSPAEPAVKSELATANNSKPPVRVPDTSRTLARNTLARNNDMAAANTKTKAEDVSRASRQQLRPEIAAQLAAANGDQIDVPAQVTSAASGVTSSAPVIEARASRQDYLNAQRFGKDSSEAANAANLPSAPAPSTTGLANARQSTLFPGNWQQPSNAYLAIPAPQQTSNGVLTFTPAPPEHHSMLSKIVDVGKRPIKRAEPTLQAQNLGRFAMTFNNGQAIQHSDAIPANTSGEATDASNLAKSPAFTARGFGSSRKSFLVGGASPYRWKITQGKLLKSADSSIWLEAYSASEGIEFSVVSAAGSEIWAGGNHGQLVHSKDGGSTWEKTALGDPTVGTVVSIENTGLNVHVITAPSQGWSSLDGGKTWIKLPQ